MDLTSNLLIIAQIMKVISIGMGISFIFGAMMKFKKYGEMRTMMSSQMTIYAPLAMLLAGTLLVMLPTFISTALYAFWGTDNPLAYPGQGEWWGDLMEPVIVFVRIVGIGSFMRGIVLLARSGGEHSQPGTLGKALIHIFAGILCVHIIGTKDLLAAILNL